MLGLPVTTKLPNVWRVLFIAVWLTVFIITTFLYIRSGCPHKQHNFTSSCEPYTYPPGLIPSFPTTYSFENITLRGNPIKCSTVDFHFYVAGKLPGFTWDFFSDINCIESTDDGPHDIATYSNVPPRGSVLKLVSRIYKALGRSDMTPDNTKELRCFFGGVSSTPTDFPLGSCVIDPVVGTPSQALPITQEIFDMLDQASGLARLLNFETPYSCNRCTTGDITFRNFTAYVAGAASYLGMATTFIFFLAGLVHVTDINKIQGKNDMGKKVQEYSPVLCTNIP